MKKTVFIAIIALIVLFLTSCSSSKSSNDSNKNAYTRAAIEGKCAVLDFHAGTNVTEEEMESISYNFRTNFHPSRYYVIESGRVKNETENLGYNNAKMSKEQLCELGRKLEVNMVVIGTINKLMDEYSVDVQIINVSKGTTVASEGNTFPKSNYRNAVKSIAQKLANKL